MSTHAPLVLEELARQALEGIATRLTAWFARCRETSTVSPCECSGTVRTQKTPLRKFSYASSRVSPSSDFAAA